MAICIKTNRVMKQMSKNDWTGTGPVAENIEVIESSQ